MITRLLTGPTKTLQKEIGYLASRLFVSQDGQSVYARNNLDGAIRLFPHTGGPGVVVPQPELGVVPCEPNERPDGLLWVCTETESFSDVWMIENFDPEYAARSR